MSVSYAPTKLSVPAGFEHLLEGLTREVLREQPPNIISFAAQYFRRKLNERPGAHEDVRKSADSVTQGLGSHVLKSSSAVSETEIEPARVKDTVSTNEQTQSIDLNDPEAHKAAAIIQTKFREHLAQRQPSSGPPVVETPLQDSEGAAGAQTQSSDRLVSDTPIAVGETTQGEVERGVSPKEPGSQGGTSREEGTEDGDHSSTHEKSIPEGSVGEGSAHKEDTSEDREDGLEKDTPRDDEPLSADVHEGSTAEDEALDDTGGDEDTETNQSMTEEDQD